MGPLAAAPLLLKAGGLAKGLLGIAGPAKTAAAASGMLKGAAAKRFAGHALTKVVGKELMSKPGELAYRLAPDVAFGVMGAVQNPGDLGDKLIAGTTQALGGGLGGIVAGRGARAIGMGERAAGMVDMGASIAGDMVGMGVGDNLMRIKGGGLTPYEKQAAAADDAYRKQIEQELLAKYGMGGDPFLYENGLG